MTIAETNEFTVVVQQIQSWPATMRLALARRNLETLEDAGAPEPPRGGRRGYSAEEVRVLSTDTGPKLVAAIKLISPGNKDRPAVRRAFAIMCASYLYQGISVIIVDIVMNRRAKLHNEILRLMEAAETLQLPPEQSLHAVAYRPLRRGQADEIDVWRSSLSLGQALPTLPLSLRADLVIQVDFEAAYAEACHRKRLTSS